MADDIKVAPSTGGSDPAVATDEIGLKHYQKIKAGWGPDGTWNETADVDGVRLPVGGLQLGTLTETAPASDTASSGLNGRLQRIAQRLTSLIALLPTSLGQKTMANGLAVTLPSDQSAIPASQNGTWTVQPGNTPNTTAWKVDGSAVTQPVSGSVTANAGTNLNTSALLTDANHLTRIGDVADAQVAAGGTGSLSAKLRALTSQIGDNSDSPASAGAVGTVSGKLRRLTTDIDQLLTRTGDVADAIVAAGATGSVSAKLRRATQGLEDLKTAIVLAAGTNVVGRTLQAESTVTASVAAGSNTSGAADCRGYTAVGIIVPATFDGSSIGFQVSVDNTTYYPLYDNSNTIIAMAVAATRAYPLWAELAGWNYVRVITATNQATTATDFVIQLKS